MMTREGLRLLTVLAAVATAPAAVAQTPSPSAASDPIGAILDASPELSTDLDEDDASPTVVTPPAPQAPENPSADSPMPTAEANPGGSPAAAQPLASAPSAAPTMASPTETPPAPDPSPAQPPSGFAITQPPNSPPPESPAVPQPAPTFAGAPVQPPASELPHAPPSAPTYGATAPVATPYAPYAPGPQPYRARATITPDPAPQPYQPYQPYQPTTPNAPAPQPYAPPSAIASVGQAPGSPVQPLPYASLPSSGLPSPQIKRRRSDSPVHIDEIDATPEGFPTASEVAYEQRLRSSFASAQGLQGPLDGSWIVSGDGSGDLYSLQLVERSNGLLEGAWRDLQRPGAMDASGFIDDIQRNGGQLTLRFVNRGEMASANLVAGVDGAWTGEMIRGREKKSITLRRN